MRDDWQYEGPDELVGIFGEAWIHQCGTEAECLETPVCAIDRPHGETDFYTLLACPDCGATRVILVRDYTGWDEPADYGFDQTWDQPREAYGRIDA